MRVIRPIFSQEGSTLAADSADFNQNANTFDAFGNVVITQPNGTTVYSDLLNYNGTTRIALLTNNVRLVDKEAVLTTNFLTYNMGTRIGTYSGGGKIVNGPDVLTSKTGYYFANTRDAYFRYDVLVNTPDALITTDTLKYNSGTRVSYFYGPTNIKGKKDKTNLYTENGRYNTLTDQAWFGKKNLYTDGSKSLKGDSLYYDGKAGFGKAINNITFIDTTQKITLKGNQGIYRKIDESALVTRNAYVVLQTKPDSGAVDSIFMTADTLRTKLIFLRDLKPANQEELKADEEIVDDPGVEGADLAAEGGEAGAVPMAAESRPADAVPAGTATATVAAPKEEALQDTSARKEVEKEEPSAREKRRGKKKGLLSGLFKGKEQKKDVMTEAEPAKDDSDDVISAGTESAAKDSLQKDSLQKKLDVKLPLDTTRTRIVLAYNKVKIFKSDLQTKADSAFYSYADSIIRCYVNPMIWTQGSQLSADTIFLQLKNQKLDNMLLQNNGFVVSTELDSIKFNQVKGKVLTGIFKDNRLYQMFVDGNAESIYYTVQDSAYSGMNRSLSSRMRLDFKDNKLENVVLVRKPEGKYYPIEKVDKDVEILKGFIWKPNERPKSKEEIIPTLAPKKSSKPTAKRAIPPAQKATGKTASKK
nr:OstA-like protein [Pedobacter xinjiangensis]